MSRTITITQTAALLFAGSLPLFGQNTEPDLDLNSQLDAGGPLLEAMTVIGSKEDTVELQGSGYYVDTEEIRTQNYSNVNRILARVPGVYVREEDGSGNFPNISLRGADGTR